MLSREMRRLGYLKNKLCQGQTNVLYVHGRQTLRSFDSDHKNGTPWFEPGNQAFVIRVHTLRSAGTGSRRGVRTQPSGYANARRWALPTLALTCMTVTLYTHVVCVWYRPLPRRHTWDKGRCHKLSKRHVRNAGSVNLWTHSGHIC